MTTLYVLALNWSEEWLQLVNIILDGVAPVVVEMQIGPLLWAF
jgi:hypothetical protein